MIKTYLPYIFLFLFVLNGCGDNVTKEEVSEKKIPLINNVQFELNKIITHLDQNAIFTDSLSSSFINDFSLTKKGNEYRSEEVFEYITLNRIVKTKNNVINEVHFDFYYDSINIVKNHSDSLVNYIINALGKDSVSFVSESLSTHTWVSNKVIFDFEEFKNGYTITLRKKVEEVLLETNEKRIPEHLNLVSLLLASINNESIVLSETNIEIVPVLFQKEMKQKTNILAFTETYDDSKLLSASFVFENNLLRGLFFDYMYTNVDTEIILSDASIVKSLITESLGQPNEVATVAISTFFEWENKGLKLEVYSDGFSIIMEEKVL